MSRPLKTKFTRVYAGLFVLWIVGSIALFYLGDNYAKRQVLTSRAKTLESLVSSHSKNLKVFNTRSLRDELVKQKIIPSDKSFKHLIPSTELDEIIRLSRDCHFIVPNICTNLDMILILVDRYGESLSQISSALLLETNYLNNVPETVYWSLVGIAFLGLFALAIGIGISNKERELTQQIKILSEIIIKVSNEIKVTKDNSSSIQSFDDIPQKIELFSLHYQKLYEEFRINKEWLTQHSKKEQFKETLAHSVHDLRGPLQEGIEFFQQLPSLIRAYPLESIIETIKSLEDRFRQARESLDRALAEAKRSVTRLEGIAYGDILKRLHIQLKLKEDQKIYTLHAPEVESLWFPKEAETLSRVLWNLAQNSFEADSTEVTVLSEIRGSTLRITVSDNGEGIPDWLMSDLFLDKITTKANGTGLGLSNAARIVKSLRGTISPVQQENGASFLIEIPHPDLSNIGESHA